MNASQPFTVLAVDDNIINLKLIEKTLSKEGFRVIIAPDGPTARVHAVNENPDLILLDIQMPGEDGFSVIRFLKEHPSTSGIPVIFLTGVSEVDAKLKGFDLGAVDYITKPFHPLEVMARVSLHLKLSIATNSLIAAQAQKLKQITEAQTALLPQPEDHPDLSFGIYYKALEEAGGDFYDILRISEDIIGFFIADFSGHDIKTSYMTASVKALMAQNCTPVYTPLETMKMVNDVLVEILPEGQYLTACYLRLNRRTRSVTVISAGHPPVVRLPKKGPPVLIQSDGDILGIFPDARFGIKQVTASEGDRFFLYSDGLVESKDEKVNWVSGAESLVEEFGRVRDVQVREAAARLARNLGVDHERAGDDVVILCVEV